MKLRKTLLPLLLLYVILGTWKGYVSIFEPGQTEPRQIFPKAADTLPQADQDALEKGIIVRNDRDLQAMLEDYLS